MKNFIIIIYTIITTSACVSNSNNSNNINNIDKVYIKTEGNLNMSIKVINFTYKNHQYLYFIPYNYYEESCVVHDPDCPCYKK